MALSVSLDVAELEVEPGGFARCEALIRNDGSEPRRAVLRVDGPAARWSWVVPSDLELGPGTEVVAGVGFRVPRGPQPSAGDHSFELVVEPETGEPVSLGGTVKVLPFVDLSLLLDPTEAEGATTRHRLTISNSGNTVARVRLAATTEEGDMQFSIDPEEVEAGPGHEQVATLVVHAKRVLVGTRSRRFVVAADGGRSPVLAEGALRQIAPVSRRAATTGALVLSLALVAGGLVALRSGGGSSQIAASGSTGRPSVTTAAGPDAACPAAGHIDQRVTGLEREQIPTLPPDYSFFEVKADGCSPVRWNPCEPVHYVINPLEAPPTAVADVREAFTRLSRATGMTYVYDGETNEEASAGARRGGRAYQPERYGERWAPILVHWQRTSRGTEDVQIVGGGFPTLAGDVYVTGDLSLNPFVVTDAETRTTVAGGFGSDVVLGPIGAKGVTWGRIILHELAHIMGLGHVRDPSQLMYPETSEHTSPATFRAGDLQGLKLVGREAGCLTTPPLDTPVRGISGRPAGGQP